MSVPWAEVKAALVAFVESTGVVPAEHVVWEREARGITYEDVVELRISAERAVGHDDVERVQLSPGVYRTRVTGHREFVLSVRFFSRSQITAARIALEKIRASLHHPRRSAILSDAGVAFLGTETLQTFDAVSDDRWESIGVLDIRLAATSELIDDEGTPEAPAPVDSLTAVGVSLPGTEPFTVE